MSKLLCVDFDFFFPTVDLPRHDGDMEWSLYDWGHAENKLFIEVLWPLRAAAFLQRDLPLPTLSGEQEGFWDRFNISPQAEIFVAESNSLAAHPDISFGRGQVDEVWLYDAHHDSGYNNEDPDALLDAGQWSCENWMVLYHGIGADLHVRYPSWKTRILDMEPQPIVPVDRQMDGNDNGPIHEFDHVFICRSGAWVPPWLDRAFFEFVATAPGGELRTLGDYPALKARDFSLESAHVMAKQSKELWDIQAAQAALS